MLSIGEGPSALPLAARCQYQMRLVTWPFLFTLWNGLGAGLACARARPILCAKERQWPNLKT